MIRFTTDALLKYVFNLNDVTHSTQWRKSAYNRLFKIQLGHWERIFRSVAAQPSEGVIPFSRQDLTRVFCQEFTSWRCNRQEGDDSIKPIVWETIPSRMLHPDHFGCSRVVTLSPSGSIPTQDTALPTDRPRLLGLLGDDNFVMVCCASGAKNDMNVFRMLTAKMVLIYQLQSRPADSSEFYLKKNDTISHIVNSDIFPGLRFDRFFDSEEKAYNFVDNLLRSLSFTSVNIASSQVHTGKNQAFWEKVCGSLLRCTLLFSWLKAPDNRARPTLPLLEGYPEEHVASLRRAVQAKIHLDILSKATIHGTLIEEVLSYLGGLRSTWEQNRYCVALKYDNLEVPTAEDLMANVNLAMSLDISRNLPKASISLKKSN